MPSSYPKLREKFMVGDDDGILKAEKVLSDSGWKVNNGWLSPPPAGFENVDKHTVGDQIDARDYLVDEWDYGVGEVQDETERA